MTGPQADAALFFFYRKERGNEPDQSKAVVEMLHIVVEKKFRKRGYVNESD